MIRIKAPTIGNAIRIETDEGEVISGIRACDIAMRPNEPVTATLHIQTAFVDVAAHPLLSLDTVTAAAEHYGFRLVAMTDDAA